MLETYEKNSKTKLVSTIVAIIVIAGVIVLADHLRSDNKTTGLATMTTSTTTSSSAPASTSSSDTTTTAPSSATTSSNSISKDGTYSASSSYSVPHGQESIQVSLTVSGGIISDVSITNSESDRDSAEYQAVFTQSYKSQVVGKKISGLQIGIVAGASDTTQGFNDALEQIASKAQS